MILETCLHGKKEESITAQMKVPSVQEKEAVPITWSGNDKTQTRTDILCSMIFMLH